MKLIFKLLLGGLSIVGSAILLLLFFTKVVQINSVTTLKWLPLLLSFVGFYVAGLINKQTNPHFLLFLLVALLIFQPLEQMYFPHFNFVILFDICALAITREEVKLKIKIGLGLVSFLIFNLSLFSEPLIIKNEGFGTDANFNLYNATYLWDFENGKLKKTPDVGFEDIQGNEVKLKTFQGKTLYLTFWATWCGPSIAEKTDLEKLKEDLSSNSNVIFVDISVDSDREAWKTFVTTNNPKGIQLISKNSLLPKIEFGFSGTPSHFILDSLGNFKECNSPKFINQDLFIEPSLTHKYLNTPYMVFQIKVEDGKEKLIRVK